MAPKIERLRTASGRFDDVTPTPAIFSPVSPAITPEPFSSIAVSASSATVTSAYAPIEYDPISQIQIPSSSRAKFAADDLLDLNLGNFRQWELLVRDVLALCGGLEEYLDPAFLCPVGPGRASDIRNWNLNDRHVRAFLRLQCSRTELAQINMQPFAPASAAALWSLLVARHLRRGTHTQVFLLHELLGMRMDSGPLIVVQAHKAIALCQEIIDMGTLDAEALAKVALLNMLRAHFPQIQSNIADAISRSTAANPFTVADIVARLNVERVLITAGAPSCLPVESALAAQAVVSRRDLICSNCKRKGHPVADCFQRGGAMEHRKQEMQDRIASRRKPNTSGPKDRAYVADPVPVAPPSAVVEVANAAFSDPSPSLLTDDVDLEWIAQANVHGDCSYEAYLAHSAPLPTERGWDSALAVAPSVPEPFLFDSGATTHISPLRSDFASLVSIPPRGIRGVNGSIVYAVGLGSIKLSLGHDKFITLDNALFVPEASVRLISVRALCDGPLAYRVTFSATDVSLLDRDGAKFFSGARVGRGLYALSGPSSVVTSALVASSSPTLETWHRRLGHANYRSTMAVVARIRASGTPVDSSSPPPKCDSCILGKQTRTPVPKVREGVRSEERGATFFVDAAGDQCTVSASGNVAPLDIIDDFSSYGWTFPVPSRAHCAPKLRDFLVARRAEGCPVRRIVMDRGECLTSDIKSVCAQLGVACETTASYTSAQNGKVERAHRTYMGKARAMRLSAGVPEVRWDEFYVTACYLTNRTPSSSLASGRTPYEAWFGKPPCLSHLREIGCRAFVLINTHNPKLRARSFECILIGYGLSSKTYRCYHSPTRRVVESFHISFIESHESPRPPPSSSSSSSPSPSSSSIVPVSNTSPPWSSDPPFTPSAPHSCPPPPSSLLPSVASPSVAPLDPSSVAPDPPASIAPVIASDAPHVTVQPRSSGRTVRPTERAAALAGLPFVSSLQRAVASNRAGATSEIPARRPRLPYQLELETALYSDVDIVLAAALQIDADYAGDPTSLREAMASPYAAQWSAALQEEFASIREMGVYILVPRSAVPPGRRVMHGKPVWRLKRDENGDPVRFKARWVIRGFEAVYGQDYTRTTSPTMRMESFRLLLHLAASLDWELLQVDVKTAFLYGLLPDDEVCYMEQPKGFEDAVFPDHVWQLRKGLYGMPQGGRTWNRTMHDHLTSVGFSRLDEEYCLYRRTSSKGTVVTGVHVDDFLAIASSKSAGDRFKADLRRAWSISDLGEARFCIGISIVRDRAARTIRISQTALIDRIIEQFGMADSFPVTTPMEFGKKLSRSQAATTDDEKRDALAWPYRALVGSLNYVAVGSRPDLSFAVQQLSQFLDCYGQTHWDAAKRVVRYLKGTRSLSLSLGGDRPAYLLGYSDSDWAGCVDTRRSTAGYCFSLGSGMISWSSRKQPSPADSSTEAEYIAAAEAAKECVWLRRVLAAIGHAPSEASPLLVDNRSAITLSGDPSFHARSKHIEIKYHILRHYTNTDQICVLWVPTADNISDIFTKALAGPQFSVLRRYLGLT